MLRDADPAVGNGCAGGWTAARQADGDARDAALHEVRKAAKRVRYTAEVGAGELGATSRSWSRAAKRVQTVLGELQDTVVTRELCRRLGIAAAAAGENAFTYGRLHGLEQARGRRAEAGLLGARARRSGVVLRAAG